MAKQRKRVKEKALLGKDRVGFILDATYAFVLLLSALIFVKIIYIQLTYKVDPRVENLFRPTVTKQIDMPKRGAILASDGKILAISTPVYQIYMDCAIQRDVFRQDPEKGGLKEQEWRDEAKELSKGLAAIFQDRTAEQYYQFILAKREADKHYEKIGKPVDHATLQQIKALPLFRKGPNKGGLIYKTLDSRQYPYGAIARRTIGYVKDNSNSNGNNLIGIEGRFNYELHGKEGHAWLRKGEKNNRIHNFDSTAVKAVDGNDVRTTLNIDLQDIADRALRKNIQDEERISGACAILMEVETGAIRALVNLQRDTTVEGHPLSERMNLAISQIGEPGSVFKTVTLTSVIEDGYIHSVDETVPTLRGNLPGYSRVRTDPHIVDWEDSTHRKEIPIKRGLEISSNYVFAYLATKYYESHPKNFYDKIYRYKLGEKFDFDIDGLGTPQVVTPDNPYWEKTSLATAGYGYSIAVTPMHLITFYNAIANDGKMMRPYLVEDVEKDGKILRKYGPGILGNICSKATADTVTRALKGVPQYGTAKKLRRAKLQVAGKTGTAQVALQAEDKPRKGDQYHDERGRKKNQGTFVGFFPADNPKYSILVTVYSRLSLGSFYGGDAPAATVREIVDAIYSMDTTCGETLRRDGVLPVMEVREAETAEGKVPDVKGFGLIDAIYAIENSGYRCAYEGSGHVVSQSPSGGAALKNGETITLRLK